MKLILCPCLKPGRPKDCLHEPDFPMEGGHSRRSYQEAVDKIWIGPDRIGLTKAGSDRIGLTKPGSDRNGLTKPGSGRILLKKLISTH